MNGYKKAESIKTQAQRLGSLANINQAVRLVLNLGGSVLSVDGLEITYTENGEAVTLKYEMKSGRVALA